MNQPVFEYLLEFGSVDLDKDEDHALLQRLGRDGWELVGWIEGKARGKGLGAKRLLYYFKRQQGARITSH